MSKRAFDIIVFGATGDTGSAACRLLSRHAAKMGVRTWAPAARSAKKLSALVDSLPTDDGAAAGGGVKPSPAIIADSSDYASLVRMCEQARVVVACAGPYALYGEPVIQACIEAGTDYCDVTGEVPWVTAMKAKYGEEASAKGLRMISFAGYDSVPSDLCAWLVADSLKSAGEDVNKIETYHFGGGGQIPTGTIETVLLGTGKIKSRLLSLMTLGLLGGGGSGGGGGDNDKKASPTTTKAAAEGGVKAKSRADGRGPETEFNPASERPLVRSDIVWNLLSPYSSLGGRFSTPHPMAAINTPVVHATAVAQGYAGVQYRERMMLGGKTGWASSGKLFPSLYGLPGAILLILGQVIPVLFALLPFTDGIIRGAVARANTRAKPRVAAQLNAGKPTGFTICHAVGESKGGGSVVATSSLNADLDAGIGFTMMSCCAIAGWLAQNPATEGDGNPVGFTTAVNAVGGKALAKCFEDVGITTTQTPAGPRSRL